MLVLYHVMNQTVGNKEKYDLHAVTIQAVQSQVQSDSELCMATQLLAEALKVTQKMKIILIPDMCI